MPSLCYNFSAPSCFGASICPCTASRNPNDSALSSTPVRLAAYACTENNFFVHTRARSEPQIRASAAHPTATTARCRPPPPPLGDCPHPTSPPPPPRAKTTVHGPRLCSTPGGGCSPGFASRAVVCLPTGGQTAPSFPSFPISSSFRATTI